MILNATIFWVIVLFIGNALRSYTKFNSIFFPVVELNRGRSQENVGCILISVLKKNGCTNAFAASLNCAA
jgi:hypothetical protein